MEFALQLTFCPIFTLAPLETIYTCDSITFLPGEGRGNRDGWEPNNQPSSLSPMKEHQPANTLFIV